MCFAPIYKKAIEPTCALTDGVSFISNKIIIKLIIVILSFLIEFVMSLLNKIFTSHQCFGFKVDLIKCLTVLLYSIFKKKVISI